MLQDPANVDAVLASGLFPGLVRAAMRAFDVAYGAELPNGQSASASEGAEHRHLTALLKVGPAIDNAQTSQWNTAF